MIDIAGRMLELNMEQQDEILRLRAENEKLQEEKRSAGERITGYIHMIEQREAEIEKLRAALKKIRDVPKHRPTSGHLSDCAWCNGSASIAAVALKESDND